jgi:N-acetyl-gamma-glutamyl-phosphate reductase
VEGGPVKSVAILGASGYTGRELIRLLQRHPSLRLAHAMTARAGAEPEAPALPPDPGIEPLDLDRLARVEGVFLCTPHGAAVELAPKVLERGAKVVDLSADFRRLGAAAGGVEAVYGLTEHRREQVARARLVANPGCYPTSILLPLLPLLASGLLEARAPIVADSKSGTSGAGKTLSERTHFGNVHENFCAYAVGTHRHAPELHEQAGTTRIVFVPHLLPVFRGILSTIYLTPKPGIGAGEVRACLHERYAGEPFVKVYGHGLPELNRVQWTNRCDVGVADAWGKVVVVSAIDNLVKGAAGQALQNMNLMLGLPETAGLS